MDNGFNNIPDNIITGNGIKVTTGDLMAAIDLVLGEIRANREERKNDMHLEDSRRNEEHKEIYKTIETAILARKSEMQEMKQELRIETCKIDANLDKHIKDTNVGFFNINKKLNGIEREAELSLAEKADRAKVARFVKNEWKWIILVSVFALSSFFLWVGQIYDILHAGG